jgi:hypothetical protein
VARADFETERRLGDRLLRDVKDSFPASTSWWTTRLVDDSSVLMTVSTGALSTTRTIYWPGLRSGRLAEYYDRELRRALLEHWFALAHDRGGYS